MTRAFVSYSRKDTDFTRTLTDALIAQKMDIWIDWKNIPPTVDWKLQIQKGIEEADTLLFLISPDSIKSRECAEELIHAVKNGKRLIPLVVRDINSEDVPKELKHINWIFFNKKDSFDEAFKKLLEAINTDYDWVQTHSRLQVKALDWERQNKENSLLLRGKDLEAAEGQLVVNASKEPKPTDLQREYVLKSKKAKETQQRITTAISIGAAVVMLFLTVLAVINAQEANHQRAEAETQRNEANKQKSIAQANEEKALDNEKKARDNETLAKIGEISALAVGRIDQDYNEALLFSVEAFNQAEKTGFNRESAKSALLTTLQSRHGLVQILPGHIDWVTGLVYSQDGKTIASSSWDFVTYLWDATDPTNPINPIKINGDDVAISPDNRTAATTYYDDSNSQVILWDISDRSHPAELGTLSGEYIVDFTPNNNYIIVINSDEEDNPIIQVWDISNLIAPTLVHWLNGTNAYLSPRGSYLAITNEDADFNTIVTLWDITNPGNPSQRSIIPGNYTSDTVYEKNLAFSSDETVLVISGYDAADNSIVKLWDISNPSKPEELSTLSGNSNYISSLAISSDDTRLALGGNNGNIFIWDISDPSKPRSSPSSDYFTGHTLLVSQIAFNPNGNTFVTGSYDGNIMLWDMRLSNPIQITSPDGYSLASSPNGKMLATQYYDVTKASFAVLLWDVSEPSKPVQVGELAGYAISANFSPDNKLIVTINYDPESDSSKTTLWNITDPANPVDYILTDVATTFDYELTFNPGGNVLAISSYNEETTMLWDTSNPDKPVQFGLVEQYIEEMISSPDNKILATASSNDTETTFWDISQSGRYTQIGTIEGYGIAFSPDSKTLAAGVDGRDGEPKVQLWNISNWKTRAPFKTLDGYGPVFSPNGKLLVTRIAKGQGDEAEDLLVWDITNPKEPTNHRLSGHTKGIASIAFTPDNKLMASASEDKTIILWDVSNPAQPAKLTILNGHSDYVMVVAFSPDGSILASGSFDGGVILWDVNEIKNVNQIGSLNGHTGVIRSIQFPEGGKTLTTSDGTETILWDIDPDSWIKKACNVAGSNFTQEKWDQLFLGDAYHATCEDVGLASIPSDQPIEPAVPGTTSELSSCSETSGTTGCSLLIKDERDRFCVETVSYTLYAVPEGTTIISLEDGFTCTDEGVSGGNQLYTCYSLEHPGQSFQANMCNTSCTVTQSDQCTTGYGLDLTQSCCTPLSSDGCIEVTLEIGNCAVSQ